MANKGEWPASAWREALQVFSDEKLVKRSWRRLAPVLVRMPTNVTREIVHALSYWLKSAAKIVEAQAVRLDVLINNVLDLYIDSEAVQEDDPVFRAINHPVGHVTQALISWWFSTSPKDDDQLPDMMRKIVDRLVNVMVPAFVHGRLILAADLIALFRVDPKWTAENMFPLLDWNNNEEEARWAWEGHLWSARLYRPLLLKIKELFLATANVKPR